MLDELHVRDLALIEEVWLEFSPGMTVLTGETGTGKTALLGALKLLLGERADSSAVRSGASEALVEGRFGSEGREILARRRVSADGRSRCTLDGEMATVGALTETIGPLVDLHGQHEHQALLASATHLGYLDRWAGSAALDALRVYRDARDAYGTSRRSLERLEESMAQAARNEDYLRFVVEEIDRVSPKPGEDDELEARLPALQHAERLSEASNAVAHALRGEGGALDRVAEATGALAKVSGIDPALDELAARLSELEILLDESGSAARSYRDSIEHDPSVLEGVLSRLGHLTALKKKYGPSLDDVIRTGEESAAALSAAGDSDGAIAGAREAVARAEAELREAARELASARSSATPGFMEALASAANDLAMSSARFEVDFRDLPFERWTADGPHRVEFLYSPTPGQAARPLARIASGGEISRVMLALKGVLGSADTVETLVFDEVDAGIGGATAHAVGARLAVLAKSHQLIVVTHLAQVAAFADRHLVVSKVSGDSRVCTSVRAVEGEDRVAEVARMLSGNDSVTSLAHAAELLASASKARGAA